MLENAIEKYAVSDFQICKFLIYDLESTLTSKMAAADAYHGLCSHENGGFSKPLLKCFGTWLKHSAVEPMIHLQVPKLGARQTLHDEEHYMKIGEAPHANIMTNLH